MKVNTGNISTAAVPTVTAGDENKIATIGNVADAINSAAWTATSAKTEAGELGKDATNQLVKAGDKVTFEADKNIKITQNGSKFTFTTKDNVSFSTVQVGGDQGPKLSKTDDGDLKVSGPNGTDPVKVTNVKSGLDTYGDNVPGTTDKNRGLVDLSKPENGDAPKVSDNTAATVGDLRNMGWIVSADKKTGDLTNTYSDTVKNANEVKFVGEGTAIVSGKIEGNVRTITVKVDDQTSTNKSVTPVSYTKKDGTKVYPKEITNADGSKTVKFYPNPDGTGTEVPDSEVITSVNGPKGTTTPTTLSNVEGNLDGAKTGTNAPTTSATAPTLGTGTNQVNKNNAATVGDVLNAGWNLQNNGTARDFVRPYDTVNFVNGTNTTAVVTTNAEGTVSDVTFNVTGLPVTYTTEDGAPVSKVGDKYYKVNDKGQPISDAGKPAVGKNNDGKFVDEDNNVIEPVDTTKPLKTALVNPTPAGDKPNTTTATQLGNVANGAKTFAPVAADGTEVTDAKPAVKLANDGKWYPADQVEPNGKPKENATPVASPLAPKNADGDVLEKGNDGKWYKAADLTDGKPNAGAPEQTVAPKADNADKAGLVDFNNSNPNNAATVGDLQNLGFVVSTSDNGYSDQVRNANKVDFKGGNGIEVTGKTTADGIREITVSMKSGDVVSTNKEGKRGTITTPEGKVDVVKGDDNKWYKESDLGVDGKPKTGADAVDETTVTINKGAGFVTGNQVGDAIEKSGWNVGLADSSKANKAFNDDSKALSADKLEKVNPDDNVLFADGKNTKVQAATMDEVNKDGKKITNTYVRFNVDLPISQITSEDKDGNKVAKAADGKWHLVKADGKLDTTKEVEPSNVRTSTSMDPDGLGDKYTSTSRKEDLTPIQLAELTGKQEAAAKAAEEKIKDLLKGQSKDVIEAASKAAVDAAKEEAKVQYLKDKGLDKGTGGTVISNVAWGTKPSDAVNVDQLQNSGINVHSRTVEGSTGKVISGNTSPTKVKMDETVNVDAGNNIEITRNGRDIAIATSMTPQFDSVQFGKEGPKITGKAAQPAKPATATSPATPAQPAELSVNGAKITGVAPGEISSTSKDAINGSQLYNATKGIANVGNRINNLQSQVNKLGNRMNAGMATSAAMANLLQPHKSGQSVATAGIGQHKDQAAVAVGYSRVSDNGKYGIRFSMGANTQGEVTSGAAVGYFW